jgi:hypothetical protein
MNFSEADLFFDNLIGRPLNLRSPLPEATEAEARVWVEAIAEFPEHYQRAYVYAQLAEGILDTATVDMLTLGLLEVEDQGQLGEFFKKLARIVRNTARDVGKTALAKTIDRAVADIGRTKLAKTVARATVDVGRGLERAGRAVPVLGTIAKLASRGLPLGAFARATYGALSATLRGQNVLMGALDGLSGTPLFGAAVQIGGGVVRGENLLAATRMAVKAGVADAREALRFAAMVAPFVPGIGTGVGAALGAADALANGQPITQALIAGVRGAIPGGAIAQVAFDTAAQLAQGKRIDDALLTAARNRLPPGPAQAAFDTGLALAQGKKLQDAVIQGGRQLLPASPYSANALAFAKRALAGDNLGRAALSTAGNAVLRRVQQQGGDLVATVQGRVIAPATGVSAKPRLHQTFDRMISASNRDVSRRSDLFVSALLPQVDARGSRAGAGYASGL